MDGHPMMLTDAARAAQLHLIAHACRPFEGPDVITNGGGVTWAVKQLGGHAIAVTSNGPNWIWDVHASARRAKEMTKLKEDLEKAEDEWHDKELVRVIHGLRFGGHLARMYWAVVRAVRAARVSRLVLPFHWLFRAVWGHPSRWPKGHLPADVMELLATLTRLHVAELPEGGGWPSFGAHTALLTDARDLRGTGGDDCPDGCPCRGGPRHGHVEVDVGRGLLGELERFARDEGEAGRAYVFPALPAGEPARRGHKRKAAGKAGEAAAKPTLRVLGKDDRLVTIYLPAILGENGACEGFTPPQHRLLRAIVRETTRRRKNAKDKPGTPSDTAATAGEGQGGGTADEALIPGDAEVGGGNRVPCSSGLGLITIPMLGPDKKYVQFNGNKFLRGRGYKLMTEGGWLVKAGYAADDVGTFLDDLAALAGPLGLNVVGVRHPTQEVLGPGEMRALALTPAGSLALESLHLRVYSEADYVTRWNEVFGWDTSPAKTAAAVACPLQQIQVEMARKHVSRRKLAAAIGVDPSFLSKMLAGKKPMPAGLGVKAEAWLAAQDGPPAEAAIDVAMSYLAKGWPVLPQLPGAKEPLVRWKEYQEARPTEAKVRGWYKLWPDAGVAIVLGPVGRLFVIDVDGEEAHFALMERLGGEPWAPKVLSGSGKPFKYHLYFRCPDQPTKAKQTPWHPQLEFKGKGGIIIAPPSLHRSGERYVWAAGRSPDEVALPEVPAAVLEALKPGKAAPPSGQPVPLVKGLDASRMTRLFLSGRYAEGPGWNKKLFLAACDLEGRGHTLEAATPLLMAGAQPWNSGEEEAAIKTIESAFSQHREPGVH